MTIETQDQKDELNVYFNSACPVCKAGIEAQQGRSTECQIKWNDVHADQKAVENIDQNLSTVRKYLHLTNADGELKVGIDAFITLWQNSPDEKYKARIFALPVVKQMAEVAYFIFANALYWWNLTKKRW